MKTTLELPDDLFRQAKATAALRGESLKDFVMTVTTLEPSWSATFAKGWPCGWPFFSEVQRGARSRRREP